MIHRILKQDNAMLKANVNELNEFFNNTAKRVTNKIPKPLNDTSTVLSILYPITVQKNPFYLNEIL